MTTASSVYVVSMREESKKRIEEIDKRIRELERDIYERNKRINK